MTTTNVPAGAKKARESLKSTPRPRDRKEQIVSAARELFADKGYAAVSADEIASRVGITAGALYRHFDGKQDLLVHGLIDALDAAAEGILREARDDVEGLVDALASVATANRELGVLWGREVRSLDLEQQGVVRAHFFRTFGVVFDRLTVVRPDLLAPEVELMTWSVLAGLTSVAYHHEAMSPTVRKRLRRVALTLCRVRLESARSEPGGPAGPGILPSGRREVIVRAATELFQQRGFRGTSMSNIGDSIGLTGAAIYRHFPTKTDLLAAIATRALGALQVGLANALATAINEQDALIGALEAYVTFALANPGLVDILLWETRSLPDEDWQVARKAQREYVAEWQALLQTCCPHLTHEETHVVVIAVLTVVNDAVRTASLRSSPSLAPNLCRLGQAMLIGEHDTQRSWNASKA